MHSTAPATTVHGHANLPGARYFSDEVMTPTDSAINGTLQSTAPGMSAHGQGTLQARYFHDEGFAKNYMSATVGNERDSKRQIEDVLTRLKRFSPRRAVTPQDEIV